MYHQAVLGDLNTMAHGIARMSPNYCCDAMRFWSLGRTEAHFWHHNVLSVQDPSHAPAVDSTDQGEAIQHVSTSIQGHLMLPLGQVCWSNVTHKRAQKLHYCPVCAVAGDMLKIVAMPMLMVLLKFSPTSET